MMGQSLDHGVAETHVDGPLVSDEVESNPPYSQSMFCRHGPEIRRCSRTSRMRATFPISAGSAGELRSDQTTVGVNLLEHKYMASSILV